MYSHFPITLLILASLYTLGEAIFFGPSAVGLGLGLLAAKKGFLLGTYLANRRTRRSYDSNRWHYRSNNHYTNGYNTWYSRPRKHYYYSSSKYSRNNWNRGKRAAEAEAGFSDFESLQRMKRDIEARGLDMETWYRDMTEMDQDSCSKKLICELRAKQHNGGLTTEESIIAEKFGAGGSVDVSLITVEFDLASQIGRNMGGARCRELYSRCDLSTSDIVEMIKKEFDNLQLLEKDLEENEFSIDNEIEIESRQLEQEIEKMNSADNEGQKSWVWT